MTDEQKYKDYQKQYRENLTDEQKQKMKDYQKEYKKNIADEQKQKYKETRKDYNITDEQKKKILKIIKNNIEKIRLMNKNKK